MKPLYILLTLLFFISCDKEDTPASGTLISGRAFYKNKFAQDSTTLQPLVSHTIYVRQSSDPDDNYYFKTITDSEGRFYIGVSTRPVTVFTKPVINIDPATTSVFYGKTEVSNAGAVTIQIIAEFDVAKQNAFMIRLQEELNGPIPAASVHVYNSSLLAAQNNPAAAVATLISDPYGKVFKTGLPAGNYYLNATRSFDTAVYQRFSKPIIIPAAGFIQDTMLMKKKLSINGFTIIVKDSLHGNIPGATIQLYNSQVLAVSNDPTGAIDVAVTNSNGVYTRSDLPAGIYYVNATKTLNNIIYHRLVKPVVLPATGFVTDTSVVLRKVD